MNMLIHFIYFIYNVGDKHLMQSLIFDAQATEVFDKNISLSIDRQDP